MIGIVIVIYDTRSTTVTNRVVANALFFYRVLNVQPENYPLIIFARIVRASREVQSDAHKREVACARAIR